MKRLRFGLLAVVVVAAAVPGARGAHVRVRDSADSRGPFDVRTVMVSGTRRPAWKIVTWDRWSNRAVRDRAFLLVYLDTFGGSRSDYYALVRSTGARLHGSLWRDRRNKRDVRVASLRVRRPGSASVVVIVPLGKVKIAARRVQYGWRVQTLASGPGCGRVCFDRAPDFGSVAEPNPNVTPTPSPSPSSTPLPTPTVLPTATAPANQGG